MKIGNVSVHGFLTAGASGTPDSPNPETPIREPEPPTSAGSEKPEVWQLRELPLFHLIIRPAGDRLFYDL
jgi:hypothetical protein